MIDSALESNDRRRHSDPPGSLKQRVARVEVKLGQLAEDVRALRTALQQLGLAEQTHRADAGAPLEPNERTKMGKATAGKPAHDAVVDPGQAAGDVNPAHVAYERLRRTATRPAAIDSNARADALGLHSKRDKSNGGPVSVRAERENARLDLVRSGEIVPVKALAACWGMTPQTLGLAQKQGEVRPLTVKRQRYVPSEFLGLERDFVAEVSRALGGLSPEEHLIFWKRQHGELHGQTATEFLSQVRVSYAREKIVALAEAWAREAGF